MTDEFEITLQSPLTQEDWNIIMDANFEHSSIVWFDTPNGEHIEFIKASVIENIKEEIKGLMHIPVINEHQRVQNLAFGGCLDIIDRHLKEVEG